MIETTSEFKKVIKTLVKGAIKSKAFANDEGNYTFNVILGDFDKKEHKGEVTVIIANDDTGLSFRFSDDVGTRVYNKVTAEFFAPIVTQIEKIKTVNKLEFVF